MPTTWTSACLRASSRATWSLLLGNLIFPLLAFGGLFYLFQRYLLATTGQVSQCLTVAQGGQGRFPAWTSQRTRPSSTSIC